jgi:PKD repeat protein
MRNLGVMFLLMVFLQSSFFLNAQNRSWCGTDIYDPMEVEKDPSVLAKRAQLEEFTEKFILNKSKEDELIIIPVVFHVVHDYGVENVSIDLIKAAIETINEDYRALNSEISMVIPEFKDIVADCKIEFRLAKLDPEGNCTEGVTRTHSLETYGASNVVKYVVPGWDPSMYLNIWVVNSIPGSTAAWSHYPGISPTLDGIVSAYNYVSPSSHTLTHEIGHYLNLAHPWGSTNDPNVPSNCDTDDNVDDTPNTIGAAVGSCNKAQFTCGSLDNVQNHMDYSACEAMYTIGQKNRMRAALNSSTSDRNNLWTEENLIATGTIDGFSAEPCEPIADFGWDENNGCQGINVQFSDNTYNGTVSTWNWEFEGGEPSTSTENNPLVTFANPGEFNVSLTVTNDKGTSTILKENIIVSNDTVQGIVYPYLEDFESENVLDVENEKAWLIENEDAQGDGWEIASIGDNKVMKASLMLTYNESLSTITSPNINIANATDLNHFTFKIAYAKRVSDSNDELKVYLSKNCGKNWALKYIKSGNTLTTNGGELDSDFEPTDDQWSEERISLTNFDDVNHFMVKFEVETSKGGTIYLDDIKFGEVETSLQKIDVNTSMKLFPNPSKGNVSLQVNSLRNDVASINVLNMSGAQIFTKNVKINQGNNIFDLSNLYSFEKGIYIIQVINSSNIHSQKLILY